MKFSVIIPTKGRSSTIGDTISSVLDQDFIDFELLIVDNNEDKVTYNLVSGIEDDRIRIIRTGNLSMPENWEFAYKNALGEYLILITDRLKFRYKNVLSVLNETSKLYSEKVITYGWSGFIENPGTLSADDTQILECREILQGFLNGGKNRHWFNLRSPKGLNAAIPRGVYSDTYLKYGKFCPALSPDFGMAFTLLNDLDSLVYINKFILLNDNLNVSNGIQSRKSKDKFRSYLKEVGYSDEEAFKFTPVHVLGVFNSMYNDLFALSASRGWSYTWKDVNMVEYFLLVHSEIESNINKSDTESDLKIWNNALSKQSEETMFLVNEFLSSKVQVDKSSSPTEPTLWRKFKKFLG